MFMFIPGTCIQHCREPRNISYNCLCLCLFSISNIYEIYVYMFMFMFIPGTCIQHCREPRNISHNCLCLCLFQEPVYNIVGNQEI